MDGTSMAISLILALEIFSLGITIVLARISAARIQMEMDKLGNRVVEALAQPVEGLPIDGEAFNPIQAASGTWIQSMATQNLNTATVEVLPRNQDGRFASDKRENK